MKKILLSTLAALSITAFTFADDFGFGDDMGSSDDFGSSESSVPAVTISGEVGAETRAWAGVNGDTKGYDSAYDLSKTAMEADAYANLELNYSGDVTDGNLKLKLDPTTLKEHPEDVIDELYANGSFKEGKFQLKAGKMKEVWGKGDKVHVLDNFNANDYSDFIFPDYIDRRIGEVMFKATANLSWDYNIKLEGIYTPWMTPDRFASDGKLVPAAQRNITGNVTKTATSGLQKYIESLEEARLEASTASSLKALAYESDGVTLKTGDTAEAAQAALTAMVTKVYSEGKISCSTSEVVAFCTEKGLDPTNSTYQTLAAKAILADKYAKYVESNLRTNLTNYTLALSNASSLTSNQNVLYPDTYTLKYGQAGLRLTGTAAGIDWGASYYYGHYKQPTFNPLKVSSFMAKYLLDPDSIEDSDKFLQYDQLQVFGLEAAFVVWKLNTRWELAYNLTEDTAGDDPWVKNNSLAWVFGFDIDLPIHNLNLNFQETGTYILKSDKIKDGLYAKYDTDYNSDDKYIKNKFIVLLSDKWLNEKLTTEVQGIFCLEDKGFMVAPNIEYNVSEGLTFGLRGVYLYCDNENGEFYNFTADSKNNDKAFLQLTAKYQF